MQSRINSDSEGFAVQGHLTAASVMGLLGESAMLFDFHSHVSVNLGQVERASSAGLALLLEWQRLAQQSGGSMDFRQVPKNLLTLAQLSDLDEVLVLSGKVDKE